MATEKSEYHAHLPWLVLSRATFIPASMRLPSISLDEVNDAVLAGLRDAEADFGVTTGLIVCGLRDRFESASLAQAELAVAYRDRGVVGFDLAGGERGNPAEMHGAAFYHARKHLLNITVHAGEWEGPQSVWDAISNLKRNIANHRQSFTRLEDTLRELATRKDGEEMEIRLWSREPGNDLFQASYPGSCVALGYGRGGTSVQALQHTFVQLAEFYNKEKEAVTGKALFFWAKDLQSGEPILILNTFEGREDGCEEDPVSRDAVVEFAKEYGKAVAGRPVKICTADSMWNTLYTADLPREVLDLAVVGNTTSGEYYFDTFSMGDTELDKPQLDTPIYRLYDPADDPGASGPGFRERLRGLRDPGPDRARRRLHR